VPGKLAAVDGTEIAALAGRKPTKRTVEMLQLHATGWATDEELLAHIAKLKKLDEEAVLKNSVK
jgi:hypothetical protein